MTEPKFKKETIAVRLPKNFVIDARSLGLDVRYFATDGIIKGIEKKKKGLI